MKILNIDTDCTDNGYGLRTVIYVSGCWHKCKGCHNPLSWSNSQGIDYTIDELIDIILENEIADVTISGGDSLTYQYNDTLELLKAIKERTNKNVWLYTGYNFEELCQSKRECLDYIDVLVDGRFEQSERDLSIQFRGSRNQRIIDVKKSLTNEEVVLFSL